MEGLGAGLGALAFWGFLAAVVVGGIWYSIRERQAQYDTVRRIIESGKKGDEALIDKIFSVNRRPDLGLKIAGVIALFVAPGLAVFAWFISQLSAPWLYPLLGAAALVAFIGIGLLVAANVAARMYGKDDDSTPL